MDAFYVVFGFGAGCAASVVLMGVAAAIFLRLLDMAVLGNSEMPPPKCDKCDCCGRPFEDKTKV